MHGLGCRFSTHRCVGEARATMLAFVLAAYALRVWLGRVAEL